MPLALRLRGDLDVVALELSLTDLIRRHEVLRTRFIVVDEEPLQQIDARSECRLEPVDFRIERDPAASAQQWAEREAQAPFSLSDGPLVRTSLLRIADDEHWLVLVLHHIAIDGWSLEIVVSDLAALYNAYRHGVACALPELPVQYADYAAWQRQWLDGEVRDTQIDILEAAARRPRADRAADRSSAAAGADVQRRHRTVRAARVAVRRAALCSAATRTRRCS